MYISSSIEQLFILNVNGGIVAVVFPAFRWVNQADANVVRFDRQLNSAFWVVSPHACGFAGQWDMKAKRINTTFAWPCLFREQSSGSFTFPQILRKGGG